MRTLMANNFSQIADKKASSTVVVPTNGFVIIQSTNALPTSTPPSPVTAAAPSTLDPLVPVGAGL